MKHFDGFQHFSEYFPLCQNITTKFLLKVHFVRQVQLRLTCPIQMVWELVDRQYLGWELDSKMF